MINKFFVLNTVTLRTSGNAECRYIDVLKQPYVLNKHVCYFKDSDDRSFYDAEMQLILSSNNEDYRYYDVERKYGSTAIVPFTAS